MDPPRPRLGADEAAPCFCVYYGQLGSPAPGWLHACRLAVLAPTLPKEAIRDLQRSRVTVLGYVSVTTVSGWEPWARLVNGSMVVAGATEWGERVVNPCSPGWRRVFSQAVDYVLSRGYNGVFLDNLDMADEYPWMRPCIARLVREVKERHPGAVVAVNRGFTLLPDIAGSIDYLLFEDFVTYYDPSTGSYHVFGPEELAWEKRVLNETLRLAGEKGFRALLLAYAPPGDRALLERICREWRSWGHGLPLYVAPGLLDRPGLCNSCSR
jgi:hypothetical protein